MSKQFEFDASGLTNGLDKLNDEMTNVERRDSAIRIFANSAALELQNYSRENAKWTDRTGDARKRLHAGVSKISSGFRITLSHGVDYGMWLELANEKRFSIILPTLNFKGPYIMKSYRGLLDKINL